MDKIEVQRLVITNELLQTSTPGGIRVTIPPSILSWSKFKAGSKRPGVAGHCRIGSVPVTLFVYSDSEQAPKVGEEFVATQEPDRDNPKGIIMRLFKDKAPVAKQ